MFVKLKYIDTDTPELTMSSVGAPFSFNTYKGNSGYDVNLSIGSSKMPGFNEWSAFYTQYRVRAAKITFECCNNFVTNVNTTEPVYMFVHVQDLNQPTAFTSWPFIRALEGNRYSKFKLLSNSGGMDKGRLSIYVDYAKFLGNKLQYNASPAYSGNTISSVGGGTDPAVLAQIYAGVMTYDGAPVVTSGIYPVHATVTQYVEFYNRVDLRA
jgi:hypothetical protein